MYVYMYICIYVHVYISIYVYMYILIYVYMYICICVYMYTCIYVHMYIRIYIYVYTHIYIYIYIEREITDLPTHTPQAQSAPRSAVFFLLIFLRPGPLLQNLPHAPVLRRALAKSQHPSILPMFYFFLQILF